MGITQSTPSTEIKATPEIPSQNTEEKKTENTSSEPIATPSEPLTATVTEQPVTPPVVTAPVENRTEVFERYVEQPGTKVEVAPVEVAPSDDVVKKAKKHKNKNKNKKE